MRYGIFSDVHSNLEALDAVLSHLKNERVDRLLCAGDLVGYGSDPSTCIRRLQENQVQAVCGNHDLAASAKLAPDWFNAQARAAVEWTAKRLSAEEREYLGRLPLVWKEGRITMAHASLEGPEQFPYVLDAASARRCMDRQETRFAFIGHTHVPGFFVQEREQIHFLRQARLETSGRKKVLINVGSVGQPRDGDPCASCCILDTDAETAEIHRVPYPVEKAQAKIRAAGLPEFLASRLELGY